MIQVQGKFKTQGFKKCIFESFVLHSQSVLMKPQSVKFSNKLTILLDFELK